MWIKPTHFCAMWELLVDICLAPFQWHPRRFSITTVILWLTRGNLSLIFINISLPRRNRWWGGHKAFGSEGLFSLVLCNNWRMFRFEDYAQYALMMDTWLQRRERLWVAQLEAEKYGRNSSRRDKKESDKGEVSMYSTNNKHFYHKSRIIIVDKG